MVDLVFYPISMSLNSGRTAQYKQNAQFLRHLTRIALVRIVSKTNSPSLPCVRFAELPPVSSALTTAFLEAVYTCAGAEAHFVPQFWLLKGLAAFQVHVAITGERELERFKVFARFLEESHAGAHEWCIFGPDSNSNFQSEFCDRFITTNCTFVTSKCPARLSGGPSSEFPRHRSTRTWTRSATPPSSSTSVRARLRTRAGCPSRSWTDMSCSSLSVTWELHLPGAFNALIPLFRGFFRCHHPICPRLADGAVLFCVSICGFSSCSCKALANKPVPTGAFAAFASWVSLDRK